MRCAAPSRARDSATIGTIPLQA